MPTTPISGLTYPLNSQTPDAPAQMADFLGDIDTMLVPRFTNATQRDARITSPAKGMMCYLLDERRFTVYRESSWRPFTVPIVRQKLTDQGWINNTTLADVTEMSIPVVSGKRYRITGAFHLDTDTVDYVDAKLSFTHPGATVIGLNYTNRQTSDTGLVAPALQRSTWHNGDGTFSVGVVDRSSVLVDGIYVPSATGNLGIQAAQDTLSAVALTFKARSWWMANEF